VTPAAHADLPARARRGEERAAAHDGEAGGRDREHGRGAKVNHLERKVGSLTPGKEADVIMLRADAINVMPLNHAYGAIVLGMDTSNVDTVFVGGKVRKWKGALSGVDVAHVRRLAEQSRDWLLAQAKWPKTVLGGYLSGH
jgi:cytosine/adenosine deaminase-related metal-dependent hydrolase